MIWKQNKLHRFSQYIQFSSSYTGSEHLVAHSVVGDQFTWWTMCLCMCICGECITFFYRLEQLSCALSLMRLKLFSFHLIDSRCVYYVGCHAHGISSNLVIFHSSVRTIMTFLKLWILCHFVVHVIVNVWLVMLFLVGDLFLVPFFQTDFWSFLHIFLHRLIPNVRNYLCFLVAIYCVIECLASLSSR